MGALDLDLSKVCSVRERIFFWIEHAQRTEATAFFILRNFVPGRVSAVSFPRLPLYKRCRPSLVNFTTRSASDLVLPFPPQQQ